jgi:hypothetical protein
VEWQWIKWVDVFPDPGMFPEWSDLLAVVEICISSILGGNTLVQGMFFERGRN